MEKAEIYRQLNQIFRTVFDNNEMIVTPEMTANDVDNWDSLTHMLLVSEIEKHFSVKFKLKDLNKMRNVGDMVEILMVKFSS